MKRGILTAHTKKVISLFVNYLILSFVFAFPYLLSREISVVYATTTSGESITLSVSPSTSSWTRIEGTSYFYLDNSIDVSILFSGIGSSSNIKNVKISYDLNGQTFDTLCYLSQASDYSAEYSCSISSFSSTMDVINEDSNGNKYVELPLRMYYEYYDGSAWQSKEYDEIVKINLESSYNTQPVSIGASDNTRSKINITSSFYISPDSSTYCKVESLSNNQVKINLTTNYPNPDDNTYYPPSIDKVYVLSKDGSAFAIDVSSSCSFDEYYPGQNTYETIMQYTCYLTANSFPSRYFKCSDIPHDEGGVVSYNGYIEVEINQNKFNSSYNGFIELTNQANVMDIINSQISIQIDHPDPFLWSVISTKGYYYLDEHIPIKVVFNGISHSFLENVKISYDFDDYSSTYACEYQSGGESKAEYSCILPAVYGDLSNQVINEKKIPLSIKLKYDIKTSEGVIERTTYKDVVVQLSQEYSVSNENLEVDNVKVQGRLNLIGSAYIANDGSSYCKIEDLSEYPFIEVNVSTNYLNPNDVNVKINKLYVSYANGESDVVIPISSSCSFVRVDAINKILTYECDIEDVLSNPYKLCSPSSLQEGSYIPYTAGLNIVVSGSPTTEYQYNAGSNFVEISYVAQLVDIVPEVTLNGIDRVDCKYYDNNPACVYVDGQYNLQRLSFNLILHNVDPTYEIEYFDLYLSIGNSYYGSGDDFDFGGCSLSDRSGLDVIYSCEYYLPLLTRGNGAQQEVYYEGTLKYINGDSEASGLIQGSFSFVMNPSQDDNAKIFRFVSNTSFDDATPQISLSSGVDGTLNCYVNPLENKCYFGNVSINGNYVYYPLYYRLEGYVFSNILNTNDNEKILDISFKISTQPNEEYTVSIYKNDCAYEQYGGFEGLYKIDCLKDISDESPFVDGIVYDPKNPPVITFETKYSVGVLSGQAVGVETSQSGIEDTLLKQISNINFTIEDVVFTRQIMDKVFTLSPGLVLGGSEWKTSYPVCRIPVYIGKYLADQEGCNDGDWSCIISNADALSRASLENAYCKFDSGIWFVGRISGIYNKSNFHFLTARYYLGNNGDVSEMSIAPKMCIDRSSYKVGDENRCDNYYTDNPASGNCIVIDEGQEDSLLFLCPFEKDLGKTLLLDNIPSDIALVQDPLVISIGVEDNGYLRNGTDVYDFNYVIENSYSIINDRINSFKQTEDKVKKRMKELKDIEHRMLTILGIITGLDVAFGAKYRPSFLSFLPGPSTCLVGCLPCISPHHFSRYGACIAEAFKVPHSLSFYVSVNGCGYCSPVIDAAFSCTLAGSMLIGKSLVDQYDNYKKKVQELDDKIRKLQDLLTTTEDTSTSQQDPLSTLFGYTSYISSSLDKTGEASKDSFARSWEGKLFMEKIPGWAKLVIAGGYGTVCVKSMFSSAGSTAEKITNSIGKGQILKSAAISMGTSVTMQWIYTGKIDLKKTLASGVVGALSIGVMGKLGNIGGEISILSRLTNPIAMMGANAIISVISGKSHDIYGLLGNFFFASGIGMAIQGAVELATHADEMWREYKHEREVNKWAEENEVTIKEKDDKYELWIKGKRQELLPGYDSETDEGMAYEYAYLKNQRVLGENINFQQFKEIYPVYKQLSAGYEYDNVKVKVSGGGEQYTLTVIEEQGIKKSLTISNKDLEKIQNHNFRILEENGKLKLVYDNDLDQGGWIAISNTGGPPRGEDEGSSNTEQKTT